MRIDIACLRLGLNPHDPRDRIVASDWCIENGHVPCVGFMGGWRVSPTHILGMSLTQQWKRSFGRVSELALARYVSSCEGFTSSYTDDEMRSKSQYRATSVSRIRTYY
jgi:hypothetical protein